MEWDSKWSRHRLKGLAIPPRGRRRSLWKVYRRSREQTWPAARLSERDTQNADEFAARDNRSEATTLRSDASLRAPSSRKGKKDPSPPKAGLKTISRSRFFLLFYFIFFSKEHETNAQRTSRRSAAGFKMCRLYLLVPVTPYWFHAQRSTDQTLSFPPSRSHSLVLGLYLSFSLFFPLPLSFAPGHPLASSRSITLGAPPTALCPLAPLHAYTCAIYRGNAPRERARHRFHPAVAPKPTNQPTDRPGRK